MKYSPILKCFNVCSPRVVANMRVTTDYDIVHQILKRNFSGAYAIPFRRAQLLLRTPVLVEKGLSMFHMMKQPLGRFYRVFDNFLGPSKMFLI